VGGDGRDHLTSSPNISGWLAGWLAAPRQVNVTIPVITSVVTFIAYAALGNELSPTVAFQVVSLFQIVRSPFSNSPPALPIPALVLVRAPPPPPRVVVGVW
jgi:hypothetical protein